MALQQADFGSITARKTDVSPFDILRDSQRNALINKDQGQMKITGISDIVNAIKAARDDKKAQGVLSGLQDQTQAEAVSSAPSVTPVGVGTDEDKTKQALDSFAKTGTAINLEMPEVKPVSYSDQLDALNRLGLAGTQTGKSALAGITLDEAKAKREEEAATKAAWDALVPNLRTQLAGNPTALAQLDAANASPELRKNFVQTLGTLAVQGGTAMEREAAKDARTAEQKKFELEERARQAELDRNSRLRLKQMGLDEDELSGKAGKTSGLARPDGKQLSQGENDIIFKNAQIIDAADALDEMARTGKLTGIKNFPLIGQFIETEGSLTAKNLVDLIGKRRSGAALSTNEEKMYKELVNNPSLLYGAKQGEYMSLMKRIANHAEAEGAILTGDNGWYRSKYKPAYDVITKTAEQRRTGSSTNTPASGGDSEAITRWKNAARGGSEIAQKWLKDRGMSW